MLALEGLGFRGGEPTPQIYTENNRNLHSEGCPDHWAENSPIPLSFSFRICKMAAAVSASQNCLEE